MIKASQKDIESWGRCVALLLGPKFAKDDPAERQRRALLLAAAALRAAGRLDLARQLDGSTAR